MIKKKSEALEKEKQRKKKAEKLGGATGLLGASEVLLEKLKVKIPFGVELEEASHGYIALLWKMSLMLWHDQIGSV